MKRDAPATSRNREPILAVLRPLLREGALVLEVASGTGQHAAFFAAAMPDVEWQPTDADPENLRSIEAWRTDAGGDPNAGERRANLRAPLLLDAAAPTWPVARVDAVVCINMIHIAPWSACEGLLHGAARVLGTGGVLYLYGPFRIGGELPAPSNVAFDASLRARDPAWGVRELHDVTTLASEVGLAREVVTPMPAKNHSVVFRRV